MRRPQVFDLVDPVLSVAAMLSVQNPFVRLTDADPLLLEVGVGALFITLMLQMELKSLLCRGRSWTAPPRVRL